MRAELPFLCLLSRFLYVSSEEGLDFAEGEGRYMGTLERIDQYDAD